MLAWSNSSKFVYLNQIADTTNISWDSARRANRKVSPALSRARCCDYGPRSPAPEPRRLEPVTEGRSRSLSWPLELSTSELLFEDRDQSE